MVSVGDAEVRELDARYVDTEDHALARAGYALRRRSGGPDEGWHIKGPRIGGGRVELHWPLGSEPLDVPAAILEHLSTMTDAVGAPILDAGAVLAPLARIRNRRTAYALRDGAGGLVAEFVDDRVTATDERSGRVQSWREWEIELGPAAPADSDAIFAAVETAVHRAGGRQAASESKLARALGG